MTRVWKRPMWMIFMAGFAVLAFLSARRHDTVVALLFLVLSFLSHILYLLDRTTDNGTGKS